MKNWWTLFIGCIIVLVLFGIYTHFRLKEFFLRVEEQEKKEEKAKKKVDEDEIEKEGSWNEPKAT